MRIKIPKSLLIFLLIIVLIIGVVRALKYLGYIPKHPVYTALVKVGLLNYCYSAATDSYEIIKQEGFDYDEMNKQAVLNSLSKLTDKNLAISEIPKIPSITHKIYFTATAKPASLDDFYIEELKVNYAKLNTTSDDWQHYIWTNNPRLFPKEITNIKGVIVKTLDEFSKHQSYKNLLELIELGQDKTPYFAQAADLLRLMAVQKHGGIYSDMDYEIYNAEALYTLTKKFDLMLGRELPARFSFYGNAFIAAKPNHPVINEALERSFKHYHIDVNDNTLPLYLRYPCNNYDVLYFNGPPLITISYFSKNNIDGNDDIILPPWMIFNLNFARLKNNTGLTDVETQECDYKAITKANFQKNNQNLSEMLSDYINNITIQDWQKYYVLKELGEDNSKYYDYENNIFYQLKYRKDFDIIGADTFCGSWTFGGKVFKRKYYWKWRNN